jgi:hypothetical protein
MTKPGLFRKEWYRHPTINQFGGGGGQVALEQEILGDEDNEECGHGTSGPGRAATAASKMVLLWIFIIFLSE